MRGSVNAQVIIATPSHAASGLRRAVTTALTLAFATLPASARAALDQVRIDEIEVQCANTDRSTAFVELMAFGAGQSFESGIHLADYDSNGNLVFDAANLFAGRAGTAWPAGATFLLATASLQSVTGAGADLVLPIAPARLGGWFLLYRLEADGITRTTLDRLDYGALGAFPLPAGHSLRRLADGTLAESPFPTPRTFSGVALSSPCFDTKPRHVLINEVGLGCPLSGLATQFVELLNSNATLLYLDSDIGIRAFDHSGNAIGVLAGPWGALTGHGWTAGGRYLIGNAGFASVATGAPDAVLPFSLDPAGGRIEVLVGSEDSLTISDSLAYGPGTDHPDLPPAGGSYQRSGTSIIRAFTPTPTTFASQLLAVPPCTPASIQVAEFGLRCVDGGPRIQFFALSTPDTTTVFDGGAGIQLFDHYGGLIAEIPNLFAARAGRPWRIGQTFLLAYLAPGTPVSIAPDAALPAPADVAGGELNVFTMQSGVRVSIVRFDYGVWSSTAIPVPNPGASRVLEGTGYVLNTRPHPVNLDGQSLQAPGCLDDSPTSARIGEVSLQCRDGGTRGQFIEFTTDSPTLFPSGVTLRLFAQDGTLLGTMPQAFQGRAGTPWAAGGTYLIAASNFAAAGSPPADTTLPAVLDTLGGRIDVLDAGLDLPILVDSLVYGPPGAPLPAPGASLTRESATTWVETAIPSPTNATGRPVLAGTCLPVQDRGVRIAEAFFQCRDGSTAAQYVELVAEKPTTFAADLGIQAFDRDGALVGDLPAIFDPVAGADWSAGTHWLIGGSGFTAVMGGAPDGGLPWALDPLGGSIELYSQLGSEREVFETLDYGGAPATTPPPGAALRRRIDGSYAIAIPPLPTPRSGATLFDDACLASTADSLPRVSELSLACLNGGSIGQFVELRCDAPVPRFRDDVGLRWFDASGALRGDVTHPFGTRTGEAWTPAHKWLLANASFVVPGAVQPDAQLPAVLDASAGRVEIYQRTAGGSRVVQSVAYGSGGIALPPPGSSVAFDASGLPSIEQLPTPTNFAGDSLRLPGCLLTVADTAPRLGEVFLQCRHGDAGQYVVVAPPVRSSGLPSPLGLRTFDHLGALLANLPNVAGGAAIRDWAPERGWLVANPEAIVSMGLTPDATQSLQLDALGGAVQVYYTSGGEQRILDELHYGAGGVALPQPGQSLTHDLATNTWRASIAAPTNQSGVASTGGQCFAQCPAALVSMSYGAWTAQTALDSIGLAGRARLLYDLAHDGVFRVEGQGHLTLYDDFTLDGVPAGTPMELHARIEGDCNVYEQCQYYDYENHCYGELASVSLRTSPETEKQSFFPTSATHYSIGIPIQVRAGEPFTLRVDAEVVPISQFPERDAFINGHLTFPDAPPWLTIRSCHGFAQSDSQTVPTLIQNATASAAPGLVTVVWNVSEPAGFTARVQRGDEPDPAWREVGQVAANAAGVVRFEDRTVAPERRYAYRLAWTGTNGAPVTAGQVSVLVPPAYRFALAGARPNPTAGPLLVAFELPREGDAVLELLDVAGRRVLARDVHLDAGDHTLALPGDDSVRPGFYLLRLRFGAESATRRVIVTR